MFRHLNQQSSLVGHSKTRTVMRFLDLNPLSEV